MTGEANQVRADSTERPILSLAEPREHEPAGRAPILIIEGGRKWIGLDLRALWLHRDLFWFLAWRDVKVRYKQTALGIAWAVLQPVLTMVVFTAIFGKLARVPSEGLPYPIFVYAGLLPWNFFNSAVTNSSNSLVGNAALITKVYFPRLVIPGSAVAAALVDFGIASLILAAMMAWYGVAVTWSILMVLPLAVMTTLTALGVGLWTSTLNVKYRDVRYALPFVLQIWLYVTPVIYPLSFIPPRWRWMLLLNPMSGLTQGFRAALFGSSFPWKSAAISSAMVLLILTGGVLYFRRMEREFADII
jgi:lipopolysaccharide transport system permease protein